MVRLEMSMMGVEILLGEGEHEVMTVNELTDFRCSVESAH